MTATIPQKFSYRSLLGFAARKEEVQERGRMIRWRGAGMVDRAVRRLTTLADNETMNFSLNDITWERPTILVTITDGVQERFVEVPREDALPPLQDFGQGVGTLADFLRDQKEINEEERRIREWAETLVAAYLSGRDGITPFKQFIINHNSVVNVYGYFVRFHTYDERDRQLQTFHVPHEELFRTGF